MSEIYFIGDLHFGHKNIVDFRPSDQYSCEEGHRELLIDNINKTIGKRDILWLMGDICFKLDLLPQLGRIKGHKSIILGNHDLDGKHFLPYCDRICGFKKYKGFWLSHAPIHQDELRGEPNIHGHVHTNTLADRTSYFNVCAEAINMAPIHLGEINNRMYFARLDKYGTVDERKTEYNNVKLCERLA